MNINKVIAIGLLIVGITTVSGQESFPIKVDVGPFVAGFNWNTSDPDIEVSDPIKMEDYNGYDFTVRTPGRSIAVLIDDYGIATDVSDETLKNKIENFIYLGKNEEISWDTVSIGGLPGLIGTVTSKVNPSRFYVAAYSPDGIGNKGSFIVTIESLTSKDLTDMFLRSLKITKT